jgi:transcriptional regulator with XRE-family HTH domain
MMETIADRIRMRMKALQIKSQGALAKRCGIEQPQINRLLAGKVKNPSYIHELALALQTTVSWLKTGEAEPVYSVPDPKPHTHRTPQEQLAGAPAEAVNDSVDALIKLYRRSTPATREDFLKIINADGHAHAASPELAKKNGGS